MLRHTWYEFATRVHTYLRLPLFVAYLMWLQSASNMPLVVVTKRQSKTWLHATKWKWEMSIVRECWACSVCEMVYTLCSDVSYSATTTRTRSVGVRQDDLNAMSVWLSSLDSNACTRRCALQLYTVLPTLWWHSYAYVSCMCIRRQAIWEWVNTDPNRKTSEPCISSCSQLAVRVSMNTLSCASDLVRGKLLCIPRWNATSTSAAGTLHLHISNMLYVCTVHAVA